MDKKLIKGGLFALAAIGTLYFYNRYAKSVKKQIEEEEKKNNEELDSLGISTDKLEEVIDPYEDQDNLVKALASACFFNSGEEYKFIDQIVDPDRALDAKTKNLIYVSQEVFKVKGTKVTDLVYYFSIPDSCVKGRRYHSTIPAVDDYCKTINSAAKRVVSEIIKFCPDPKTRLVGVVTVSYNDPKDPEMRISERLILDDPTVYEELKDDTEKDYVGLERMLEGVVNKTLPDSVNLKLADWANRKWNYELPGFKIVEFSLLYRVSYVLRDRYGVGISLKSAFETLLRFVKDINILTKDQYRKNHEINNRYYNTRKINGEKYESVLFCAPSPKYSNHFDLTQFYYADRTSGKIEVDSYSVDNED